MVYKIRCNPMHPIYGTLPVLYVPVRITRSAVVEHRYIYMRLLAVEHEVPCTGLLYPSHCLCETILHADPVFDGVRLTGFKSRANVLQLA